MPCLFCGSPGPLTDEHAIPRWARKAIGATGLGRDPASRRHLHGWLSARRHKRLGVERSRQRCCVGSERQTAEYLILTRVTLAASRPRHDDLVPGKVTRRSVTLGAWPSASRSRTRSGPSSPTCSTHEVA